MSGNVHRHIGNIEKMPSDENLILWPGTALSVLVNALTHPVEYAKVLIQIGHEPISPYPTRTFFGRPALALPNIYRYVKYIKSVDGVTGCYRGLVPKLCAFTVNAVVTDKAYGSFESNCQCQNKIKLEEEDDDNNESAQKYFEVFLKDLSCKSLGIIACHPLDVISIRMMAQFVGGETKYNGLIQSFIEIYKDNGIAGYFAGLVPRLIANAVTLLIVNTSMYFITKYLIRDRETKGYIRTTTMFLASTVTYPFLVVSHCMAVNNCNLAAGMPPHMPIYTNWVDCWIHLSSINQLNRGNSLLWRYYTGPINSNNLPWSIVSSRNAK